MPPREIKVRVTLEAIAGLAECMVCGCVVSFEIPYAQIEDRIGDLRCPRCGGSSMPQESTLFLKCRTEPA